ncbi:MAG: hypothetical protein PHQ05_07090 [Sterolibacterium sp.]|nr:hypothetical protein [Sterolibacterium sp.]
MDYALSRLQARFGERPDESFWQKLETVPEPAAALEIARSSGLRRWVAGIAPRADSHEIEIVLRARWRESVTEISSWVPASWQPSLLWSRGLVDLPALCYLARGATPLPWMFDDPVLQVYARADSTTRETMLREDCRAFMGRSFKGTGQPVLPASPGPSQIYQAWLDEWRQRWPGWSDTALLENLVQLFDAAMKQPAAIGHPELLRKLRSLFRCSVLRPVAVFIHIAFAALDIERLRAGLLKHDLARKGIIPS